MVSAFVCALAVILSPLKGQKQDLPEAQMGIGQLVFLVSPTKAPSLDEKTVAGLQRAHLKRLEELWSSRKALVVGPLQDAGPRRGIVLLDVKTPEEAAEIMAEDPLVKAGMLRTETFSWFLGKNYVLKGDKFMDLKQFWFGLLERPENPPPFSDDELKTMQEGHMANITKMATERSLLIAGPIGGNGPQRGVFVFKGMKRDDIDDLTRNDPLIKSGRLKLTLFKWFAPKGSFLLESKK